MLKISLANFIGVNDFFTKVFSDLSKIDSINDSMTLYYLLPLIERVTIETLDTANEINIEVLEQGRYRTLNSILSNDDNQEVLNNFFNPSTLMQLREIYQEDGLRNQILKSFNEITDEQQIESIKYLAYKLLKVYADQSQKETDFEEIPLLE